MSVLMNEGRRRIFFGIWVRKSRAQPCHYRHGPCQLSGFLGGLYGMVRHGHASAGTASAKVVAFLSLIFFVFLNRARIITIQNNLKQRKTNKIKAIKCVGCLPRSARLESLA